MNQTLSQEKKKQKNRSSPKELTLSPCSTVLNNTVLSNDLREVLPQRKEGNNTWVSGRRKERVRQLWSKLQGNFNREAPALVATVKLVGLAGGGEGSG